MQFPRPTLLRLRFHYLCGSKIKKSPSALSPRRACAGSEVPLWRAPLCGARSISARASFAVRAPFAARVFFVARNPRARHNALALLATQLQPRVHRNALAMLAARFQSRARQIAKSAASQHPSLFIQSKSQCCASTHLRSGVGWGVG